MAEHGCWNFGLLPCLKHVFPIDEAQIFNIKMIPNEFYQLAIMLILRLASAIIVAGNLTDPTIDQDPNEKHGLGTTSRAVYAMREWTNVIPYVVEDESRGTLRSLS
jgi:hypothetical protein